MNLFIHGYCEKNISISQIWIDDGLSPCFHFTVVSILVSFSFIFGMLHCIFCQKRGTSIEPNRMPSLSLYVFQQGLSGILLIQFIGLVTWRLIIVDELPGYVLFYGISSAVFWAWAIALLALERGRIFVTDRTKGHITVLVLTWALAFMAENSTFISLYSDHWWWNMETNKEEVEYGLWFIRFGCTGLLFFIGLKAPGLPRKLHTLIINEDETDVEQSRQTLLVEPDQNQSPWQDLKLKLHVIFALMWPTGSCRLQFIVLFCLFLLAAERAVNVLVPIQYKNIVNQLSDDRSWDTLTNTIYLYTMLKFLQGGGSGPNPPGILSNMRSYLWVAVQGSANTSVKLRLFDHLNSLSLRWHLQQESGDILKSIDRGIACIGSLFSLIVFCMVPTIADIVISIIFFIIYIKAWFGLLVFFYMILFLGLTLINIEFWPKKTTKSKEVDLSLNFETAKYYNTENYEFRRYCDAISKLQWSNFKEQTYLAHFNQIHNFNITLVLMVGSMFCAAFVMKGKLEVGDFVLFGTYILQLYTPLNWFGTYYRNILELLGDMEILFKLFEEYDKVKDEDNARNLIFKQGKVEFEHVSFSYIKGKEILQDVSFTVQPGQTVALVGQSGSGKTTIIRLLLRLYDIQGGYIRVDGEDISKVKQASLRAHIGVVPQDTVLFNDNIRDNIRYGCISASDQQVEEAAVAADIHDKIMSFPEGYDTQVGERGLQLSGGEKQRVAIARTILKDPQIILLDEATSALDTQTERTIQASLARICANRTTIFVAHRLSTVIGADQIYVLNGGCIAESGRHEELLAKGGLYADMWREQQQTQHSFLNTEIGDEDPSTSTGLRHHHHHS